MKQTTYLHRLEPRTLAAASAYRKPLWRDAVRLERFIGLVLWGALFAVLLRVGR